MDEPEEPADLAHEIMDADRPSKPIDQRLRLQWNVPFGVPPYVPLWLSLAFGLVVLIWIVDGLARWLL